MRKLNISFFCQKSIAMLLVSLYLLASCTPIQPNNAPQPPHEEPPVTIPILGDKPPDVPQSSGLPRPSANLGEANGGVAATTAETGTSETGTSETGTSETATSETEETSVATVDARPLPTLMASIVSVPTLVATPTPETINGPITVAFDPSVNPTLQESLRNVLNGTASVATSSGSQPLTVLGSAADAGAVIRLSGIASPGASIMERYYAAVVPFDTVRDEITLAELQQAWQSGRDLVATSDVTDLSMILGQGSAPVVARTDLAGVLAADRNIIGILPFDQLDPTFKVLTVEGVNLLSNHLPPNTYPLGVALKVEGVGASLIGPLLRGTIQPVTNRDGTRLTTLVMTGVTAMARGTAEKMEEKGYTYPAEIIGPTLAEADITHISNEIPFLDDCVVENYENNLTLCSDTTYWAALAATGADIIGLSGNHVNDFGYEGARRSLTWYKENNIPIYGSGFTVDEACAPLVWTHNGNRFAFLAALAFGPGGAWVTDTEPGACYYYEHKDRILASIRELAQQVDIVAVELQFEESYQAWPLDHQVIEFRELHDAGADIMTGVQSHVPQAMEPYGMNEPGGNSIIVYGLGNLFFDQMWSWETRSELYARHTLYQGRLLSTEILTGVLEDYAQPRWATPDERVEILTTIFNGAPSKP